jgi:hypothetical protein
MQCDPFRDLPDGGWRSGIRSTAKNTRGQCLLYAANQLAYQHRLFAFSLVIYGTRARFIRWDREGAVVSCGIDCSQRHELLIEFLQRFNQLTAEQRGLDPTAIPATPEEIETFESAVAKIDIEPLKRSVGDRNTYPRYRLEVGGPNDIVSLHRWDGVGLPIWVSWAAAPEGIWLSTSVRTSACSSRTCGGRTYWDLSPSTCGTISWSRPRFHTWSSSSTRPTSFHPPHPYITTAVPSRPHGDDEPGRGTARVDPSSGMSLQPARLPVTRTRPLPVCPGRIMPTTLGIHELKAPRHGSVGLTRRLGSARSHFDYPADVRPDRAACSSAFSDATCSKEMRALGTS